MAVSRAWILACVCLMLITGVCNTLLTKAQNNICVAGCNRPADDIHRRHFEQPVVQTLQMFIGESGCWLVIGLFTLYSRYANRKGGSAADGSGGYEPIASIDPDTQDGDADGAIPTNEAINPVVKPMLLKTENRLPLEGWKSTLLALPAICDIVGTTLMNVGLLFVVPSIYQMTRGALVLFVGLFSVIFLKRKLQAVQWFALVVVVVGVGIVGLAGAIYPDEMAAPPAHSLQLVKEGVLYVKREVVTPEAVKTIIGIFLIAGAQIFTATQFVLEEHILEKYALEPIKLVGWEGTFGALVTVLLMIILHLTIGSTEAGRHGYFNAIEGLREVTTIKPIAVLSILIMFSIGGFNFFGLSISQTLSSTTRSVIDTCRTLGIWIVSIALGWENFKLLQVLGFALLVYGTFLFNGLVRPPLKMCVTRKIEELLPEEPIEHV